MTPHPVQIADVSLALPELRLSAQDGWRVDQGGGWEWHADGVNVVADGSEWVSLTAGASSASALSALRNVVIELTLSGAAEAAGLSFGHFKDFLMPLDGASERHHLQLEIDLTMGCWAFRVDGRLQARQWWDAGIAGVSDFLSGPVMLKARRVEIVRFHELTVHSLDSSCRLSVVITCHRFLQRLRLSLRNWCHQDLASGAYELLVVNPESPDGTHEHLAAVARSYPHIRVREIPVDPAMATNKGAMINRAMAAARGEWIWVTDADCLFPPDCAAAVLASVGARPHHLSFGQRRYLTPVQTDALLAGRADGIRDFHALAAGAVLRAPENAPWGYTQIVNSAVLDRVRYREDLNHFAHTDGMFVADCKRHGIAPRQLDGLVCLHLDHPFAWYGTAAFL